MPNLKLSVIVPTRNRPHRLGAAVAALGRQAGIEPGEYELVVVDDGSEPAVELDSLPGGPALTIHRLEHGERSAARNHGARSASGELLVFLDDDMLVQPNFLSAHWQVHVAWPQALQFGPTPLPAAAADTPFGRFRQALEDQGGPDRPAPVEALPFATAQNMGISRAAFMELGGFDPGMTVAEDRDLAVRHADRGRPVVFVPGAPAVHDDDDALDLPSYCARAERYMGQLVGFGRRHTEVSEAAERAEVNGPLRPGREPPALTARKLLKSALMIPPLHAGALALVRLLERVAPDSRLLTSLYRLLLGAHLQRGFRRGLRGERV